MNAVEENNAIIRDIEREVETPTTRVVGTKEFCAWPEWTALAARMGLDLDGVTKVNLALEVGKLAELSVTRVVKTQR